MRVPTFAVVPTDLVAEWMEPFVAATFLQLSKMRDFSSAVVTLLLMKIRLNRMRGLCIRLFADATCLLIIILADIIY